MLMCSRVLSRLALTNKYLFMFFLLTKCTLFITSFEVLMLGIHHDDEGIRFFTVLWLSGRMLVEAQRETS